MMYNSLLDTEKTNVFFDLALALQTYPCHSPCYRYDVVLPLAATRPAMS